jgi:hypothetical protein
MICFGYREVTLEDGEERVVSIGIECCEDLKAAKDAMKSRSERNACDARKIYRVYGEFHDANTKRTWSVYGIGLSKRDYWHEETNNFLRRYRRINGNKKGD